MTVTKRQQQVYRAIAARLGLRIRIGIRHLHRRYTYTGRTIQPEFWSEVAHEIGHALAAPLQYRYLPEYGWGYSYERMLEGDSGVGRPEDSAEEGLASLLGILLKRRVESHEAALDEYEEHNWVELGWREVLSILRTPEGRRGRAQLRKIARS